MEPITAQLDFLANGLVIRGKVTAQAHFQTTGLVLGVNGTLWEPVQLVEQLLLLPTLELKIDKGRCFQSHPRVNQQECAIGHGLNGHRPQDPPLCELLQSLRREYVKQHS